MTNRNVSMHYALILMLLTPIVPGHSAGGELHVACGTGAPDRVLRGVPRDELLPPFTVAARYSELLVLPARAQGRGFEDSTAEGFFGHTFHLPPGNIVRAELEIRMQPIAFLASNDLLYLGREADDRFTFFWRIEDLPEAEGVWEVGRESVIFRLVIAALPDGTDLLPKINTERTLAVQVRDDTTIHDVSLAIWKCPAPSEKSSMVGRP